MPKAAEKPRPRTRKLKGKSAEVGRSYFEALAQRDADAMVGHWAPGGIDRVAPIGELRAPDEIRAFFSELFAAVPDLELEVLDLVAEGDRIAVRWRIRGTFAGAPFQSIEPTGARVELEGIDLLQVEDGLIRHNDAYYDGAAFARQVGMLPPRESAGERRLTAAFNVRTRVTRSLFAPAREKVADGVWLLRGGFPKKTMNVYLIEDDGGVTVYDAGTSEMSRGIAAAGAAMGGIKRVLLGHSHADHRGAARSLAESGTPVLCHPGEVADAEGDGGEHYFNYAELKVFAPGALVFPRLMMPRMIHIWDGGPVSVADTVSEGDEVAGFEVVHLPGHAPGLVGLWRESDRLALVSDTLYTLDPETGRYGPARVPHHAFNRDTGQARESIRKLAAMDPAAVWPGHANAVTGDVRAHLESAAEAS